MTSQDLAQDRPRAGESRWPMALAVLAAAGLRAALPSQRRDGDARWAFAAVVAVLLGVLITGLLPSLVHQRHGVQPDGRIGH
jgi:hypothetical protein